MFSEYADYISVVSLSSVLAVIQFGTAYGMWLMLAHTEHSHLVEESFESSLAPGLVSARKGGFSARVAVSPTPSHAVHPNVTSRMAVKLELTDWTKRATIKCTHRVDSWLNFNSTFSYAPRAGTVFQSLTAGNITL